MNNFTVGMLSDSELLSGISISMQLRLHWRLWQKRQKRSVCRASGAQCADRGMYGMVWYAFVNKLLLSY
jgi:hypothetical protein